MIDKDIGLQLLYQTTADRRVFQKFTDVETATSLTLYTAYKITTDILIQVLYGCYVFSQKVTDLTSRKGQGSLKHILGPGI